ncbi:hypothetical protein AKO1_006724 [Acrasis kona]|uniref:Uncharacterized protein n=1 Tax=Acrasis kona TaxID=1008807 RepID=A0AAW2YL92_9EUKA
MEQTNVDELNFLGTLKSSKKVIEHYNNLSTQKEKTNFMYDIGAYNRKTGMVHSAARQINEDMLSRKYPRLSQPKSAQPSKKKTKNTTPSTPPTKPHNHNTTSSLFSTAPASLPPPEFSTFSTQMLPPPTFELSGLTLSPPTKKEPKVDLQDLAKMLGTVQSTMDSFQNTLGTVHSRMDSFQNTLGTVQSRMDTFQNTLGTVHSRMDSFQNTLGTVQNTLFTMSTDFNSRLDRMSRRMGFYEEERIMKISANHYSKRANRPIDINNLFKLVKLIKNAESEDKERQASDMVDELIRKTNLIDNGLMEGLKRELLNQINTAVKANYRDFDSLPDVSNTHSRLHACAERIRQYEAEVAEELKPHQINLQAKKIDQEAFDEKEKDIKSKLIRTCKAPGILLLTYNNLVSWRSASSSSSRSEPLLLTNMEVDIRGYFVYGGANFAHCYSMGEIKSAEGDIAYAKMQLSLRLNVIADAIVALYPNGKEVNLRGDIYCVSERKMIHSDTESKNPKSVNLRRHISFTIWS